ncbi:MAG: class 1 fructose-bisphosphatase [Nitrospirae bacterium]|nr:class 1 fructose-bisphosphatase [Nitrospirota bacterium]
MKDVGITLIRHILMERQAHPLLTDDLLPLLTHIGVAAKIIGSEIRRIGLGSLIGKTGGVNIQGEEVKKLDKFANDAFIWAFEYSGLVCTMISEEMEEPMHLEENCPQSKYFLLVDPIDGSSNVDVNGPLGSIFSFFRQSDSKKHDTPGDLMRRGSEQVVSGYIMYGPSTILVYTLGKGIHAYTLDPIAGEFILSHENIRIPSRGRIYSVNEGNYNSWQPEVREYCDYLKGGGQGNKKPYSLRYVGSLVADLHRTLLEGGVFFYPGDREKPEGKLRLLYEVAPLAFVVEQAGGLASTGTQRILDIKPTALHQRVPLFLGSIEEVKLAEEFVQGRRRL